MGRGRHVLYLLGRDGLPVRASRIWPSGEKRDVSSIPKTVCPAQHVCGVQPSISSSGGNNVLTVYRGVLISVSLPNRLILYCTL